MQRSSITWMVPVYSMLKYDLWSLVRHLTVKLLMQVKPSISFGHILPSSSLLETKLRSPLSVTIVSGSVHLVMWEVLHSSELVTTCRKPKNKDSPHFFWIHVHHSSFLLLNTVSAIIDVTYHILH
eukprot:TRINITY_DN12602_c0_g1_i1.p1 TRINITY_DN12602_c0_g1~~TRINITY_DN12602_c0_g1_i1.p1  ORF type:complete len:125 (-),score=17.51 TRINITY_DN12602_c0_g1_i1:41-415(-)